MKQLVIKSLKIEDSDTNEGKSVYVEGFISAPIKDLENEEISEDALQKIVRELTNPPYNKVFLEHAPFKQNTPAIEKIPIGIIEESEFKNGKPWVRVKLNKAHPLYETVKQSLKEGFLDAFSISFKPLKTKKQGSKTIITDLQILEVSLVGLPANPEATVERVYEKQFTPDKIEFEEFEEDVVDEKCKYRSWRHHVVNHLAWKLRKAGKLRGLRRKGLEEIDGLKVKTGSGEEKRDCKPPEETGGEMVGETCSGWIDERTGKELTWAEFKRRLAVALGIKPTQYIRNIFYAAYKQGLLSKEDMRKLGYNVKDDKEKKELTGLKSLKFIAKNMEEVEVRIKELEATNSELQNQIKELEAKLKELEAEKAKLEEAKKELETKLKEMVEEKKAELIDEIKTIQPDANEEELKQKDVSELKDLALKAYRTKVLKLSNLPNKLPAGSDVEGANWDKIFGLKR